MAVGRYRGSSGLSPDTERLEARVVKRGLLIGIVIPFVFFMVAFVARENGFGLNPENRPDVYSLLLYVLIAVGIADLAVAWILRKRLFHPDRFAAPDVRARPEAIVMQSATIVLALGAAPMIYGVVLYLLGGDLEAVAYFAILNLLAVRFLRPDGELLEALLHRPQADTSPLP